MKNVSILFFAAVLSFTAVIPTSAAYNGTVSTVRLGEHPFQTREREVNRRKRLQEENKRYGYFRFDNPAYLHPIYAKKSTLHPFYRKGGTSQNINVRYAGWRGYLDPIQAHQLSPDTYCSNFSFAKIGGAHGKPVGYQCF
ncbi:MAG: hypothetical protein O3A80_04130 [bacterium]|nr:hypothetical protein [bacterium]MDA1292796.1 hypothetical protein [bacterium]